MRLGLKRSSNWASRVSSARFPCPAATRTTPVMKPSRIELGPQDPGRLLRRHQQDRGNQWKHEQHQGLQRAGTQRRILDDAVSVERDDDKEEAEQCATGAASDLTKRVPILHRQCQPLQSPVRLRHSSTHGDDTTSSAHNQGRDSASRCRRQSLQPSHILRQTVISQVRPCAAAGHTHGPRGGQSRGQAQQ